jgi:signal transduction histidine kinase
VRPRALDEGLRAALRSIVRTSPVPIRVAVPARSLPDSLAATAYYVAAEAVANALKHASPTEMRIDVSETGEHLCVAVSDDGCGGARLVAGRGLAGLRDRVLASGGELFVESDGGGTTVRAVLPCAS